MRITVTLERNEIERSKKEFKLHQNYVFSHTHFKLGNTIYSQQIFAEFLLRARHYSRILLFMIVRTKKKKVLVFLKFSLMEE